jgi:hypothetical protein
MWLLWWGVGAKKKKEKKIDRTRFADDIFSNFHSF